uniref:Transmembrane protein 255B n=1 Tax=Moschus moschiferus TaxID=68415 RepID=A0A8C6FG13_MOSMO
QRTALAQDRAWDKGAPIEQRFVRRKKTTLWFVGALLVVSAAILAVGLAATTRTENVTVGGYYPGIILGFGSFLGIIGVNLVENRKQMLVAAIVFISFGVVAAFCCAVVDGVFAARHIVSPSQPSWLRSQALCALRGCQKSSLPCGARLGGPPRLRALVLSSRWLSSPFPLCPHCSRSVRPEFPAFSAALG